MGAMCSGQRSGVDEFDAISSPAAGKGPQRRQQGAKDAECAPPATLQHQTDTAVTEASLGTTMQSQDVLHARRSDAEQQQQQGVPNSSAAQRAAAEQASAHEVLGKAFTDMTQLCSMVCKVELCTVSLVASDAPWLPSTSYVPFRDTPFCSTTLQQPAGLPLVVPDTLLDSRFASSIHVTGPPHIRFYAGVPLCNADGKPVAALCIMDSKPASEGLLPADARRAMLSNFADMATRELAREQALQAQTEAEATMGAERARLLRMMDLISDGQGVLLLEVPRAADTAPAEHSAQAEAGPHPRAAGGEAQSSSQALATSSASNCFSPDAPWRVLGINDAWHAATGLSSKDVEGRDFWSLFRALGDGDAAAQAKAACFAAVASKQNFTAVLQPVELPGASASAVASSGEAVGSSSAAGGAVDARIVATDVTTTTTVSGGASGAQVASKSSAPSNSACAQGSGDAAAGIKPATLQLVFRCVEGGANPSRGQARSDSVHTNAAPSVSSRGPDAEPAAGKGPRYYCVSIVHDMDSLLHQHSRWSRHSSGSRNDRLMSSASMSTGGVMLLYGSGAVSGSNAVNLLPSNARSAVIGDRAPLLDDQMIVSKQLQVVSLLGHGSFGRVYLGQYNGEPVAIKILEWEAQGGGSSVLEALLSTQIEHPNIVRTYKHGTRPLRMARHSFGGDDGVPSPAPYADGMGAPGPGERRMMETWMMMEYADRGTLSDAVEQGLLRGGLASCESNTVHLNSGGGGGGNDDEPDLAALLATAGEVASAMTYLHSLDILHGDLTGSNILLCSSARPTDSRGFVAKVADFGLSRVLATDTVQTKTYGAVSHTPPELLLTGCLSKAVDVYAFGVILWEMLMGQPPYKGLTQAQIINHISNGRGLALYSECPSALRKLVGRCLALRPEERPTFAQVQQELDALKEELSYG